MNEIEKRIEEVKKEIVDTRRIYQDKPDGKKSFKGLYKVEERVRVLEAELKALEFCNNKFAEFLRRLREADEDIIVYNDYIDKYFPKGDKRRGEVLAILGDIWTRLENNKDNLAGEIK